MLAFQPPGFGQRVFKTALGILAYYTPIAAPWRNGEAERERPPLVFLHSLGVGSSAYEWSKVYSAFAPHYRVIAPDLIGWGQSAHPARSYRVQDYFLILTELLEQLAPATVVASSLTAGLIIRLAIQRPDLFKMLFLISPSGYADFGAAYGAGIAIKLIGIAGIDRLLYRAGAANAGAIQSFLEQFLFADRSRLTPEMVSAYLESANQHNAEYAALSSLRGDLCFDLALYIDQLKTPTFIIWGTNSRLSRIEIGKRLVKLNPEAIQGFWAIDGVGVMPHLETPEVIINLLNQTLKLQWIAG
jgi:pimeloyl-ACP methyl ester carboxylesterase